MADCNLCIAVVGNHTVPIPERRRIRVKSLLIKEITNDVGWKKQYMQLNYCILSQIHAVCNLYDSL